MSKLSYNQECKALYGLTRQQLEWRHSAVRGQLMYGQCGLASVISSPLSTAYQKAQAKELLSKMDHLLVNLKTHKKDPVTGEIIPAKKEPKQ